MTDKRPPLAPPLNARCVTAAPGGGPTDGDAHDSHATSVAVANADTAQRRATAAAALAAAVAPPPLAPGRARYSLLADV